MKTCKICNKEKQLSDFGIDNSRFDRRNIYCKECLRKKHITPEARIKARGRSLKATYNITADEYNDMLTAQGGVCAICSKPNSSEKPLSVDHCHTGSSVRRGTRNKKKVRGLLCEHCNHGLGKFFDNVNVLQNAIEYLKNTDRCKNATLSGVDKRDK